MSFQQSEHSTAQQHHRQHHNEKPGNHLPSSYIAFGGVVCVKFVALKSSAHLAPRYTQPPHIDTKLSEDVESTISFFPRSKYRIAVLLIILLVILGALVAMSIAIISQGKALSKYHLDKALFLQSPLTAAWSVSCGNTKADLWFWEESCLN